MPLRSLLLRGDPKLEAAAQVDSAHIVPGSRGPHVLKIQQALIQVSGASITPDGIYGPNTAAAVADFKRKHRPQILNFAGKIDDIVGIKTLAELDAALPKGGGGLNLNFDITVTPFDIVVNFKGDPAAHPLPSEDALPQGMIKSYDVVLNNNKLLRNRDNRRLLLRIAHTTVEIGPNRSSVFSLLLKQIKDNTNKDPDNNNNTSIIGRVYVIGTSSGGRNALDFVGELSKSGIPVHFIASIEASFTQKDTQSRPNSPGRTLNTHIFKLPDIVGSFAGIVEKVQHKHNYFQTEGNHRGESINPFVDPFFTSDMAGGLGEIHGSIEGFTNHPLVIGSGLTQKNDDQLHEEADPTGRREAQLLIARDLQSI